MRMFAAAAVVTLVCIPVLAQQRGGGRGPAQPPTDTTNATVMTAAEVAAGLAKLGNDRQISE